MDGQLTITFLFPLMLLEARLGAFKLRLIISATEPPGRWIKSQLSLIFGTFGIEVHEVGRLSACIRDLTMNIWNVKSKLVPSVSK